MGDDQDGLADVVEEDHPVVEGEREVGQAAVVGRGVGQVLGVADGVVGGVADGAAGEPGQARAGGRPGTSPSRASSSRNGSSVGGPAGDVGVERVEDADLAAPGLEPEERLGAEEAEPADLLAADDALEQERGGRRSILRKAETGVRPSPVSWR